MATIIWSNSALSDLSEIADYIGQDSPKFAEITLQKLYYRVEILSTNSKIGRIVPELEKEHIRELIEGNYRIIYEINNTNVYILAIHHSSRMLRL